MKCVYTGPVEGRTELEKQRQRLLTERALAALRQETLRKWDNRAKTRYIVEKRYV